MSGEDSATQTDEWRYCGHASCNYSFILIRESISSLCAFSDYCCPRVTVTYDEKNEGLDKHQLHVFTTYMRGNDSINDRAQYKSLDGTKVIAYNNEEGSWYIQPEGKK